MISQLEASNIRHDSIKQSFDIITSWSCKVVPRKTFIKESPPSDLLSEEIWNVVSFQFALYVCAIKNAKILQYARNHYHNNKEKYKKLCKEWRDNNPDKMRIYRGRAYNRYKKDYYQKNKEKNQASCRKYYQEHKEEISIKNKISYQEKKKQK